MSYPSPYELEAESLITLAFESEKVARIEEINSHKLSPSGSFNISSWTNQQAPIDMRITIRLKDSPSPPIIEEFHYTQSVFNYKPSIDAEKLISPSTSNNVGITKDISNEKVTQIRHITPTPKKAVEKIKLNTIRIENNCSAPRKSNALPTSYAVNHVLHRKMKSDAERVKTTKVSDWWSSPSSRQSRAQKKRFELPEIHKTVPNYKNRRESALNLHVVTSPVSIDNGKKHLFNNNYVKLSSRSPGHAFWNALDSRLTDKIYITHRSDS